MLCPNCHGTGQVQARRITLINEKVTTIEPFVAECSFPGCHRGQVSCCDADNDGLPKVTLSQVP